MGICELSGVHSQIPRGCFPRDFICRLLSLLLTTYDTTKCLPSRCASIPGFGGSGPRERSLNCCDPLLLNGRSECRANEGAYAPSQIPAAEDRPLLTHVLSNKHTLMSSLQSEHTESCTRLLMLLVYGLLSSVPIGTFTQLGSWLQMVVHVLAKRHFLSTAYMVTTSITSKAPIHSSFLFPGPIMLVQSILLRLVLHPCTWNGGSRRFSVRMV
ncbi:hypothetical protein CVT26_006404 [Gymnopilus dilepis]|uniref:Uncharacterized protein n=1 Tax=Gymnopilus dilepis TaxID=231916 RepID=A0A409W642_9AGAR|nr:hypothetical protein CVT26_006404 [Gymnopilus dilepis]